MPPKTDNIAKIIARLEARIAEGQYYEAQQQTRVVSARYTKAANWDAAIAILVTTAQALLRAGQGGSGGDLCVLIVDVYRQASRKPDTTTRGQLLACLRLFDSEEPTRRKFVSEMISWSAVFGDFPAGDPELHHVIGTLLAQESQAYDAERHLVLGTRDSVDVLVRLEYAWYAEDAPHTAALYAARGVLPYLLVANVRAANDFFAHFTAALRRDKTALAAHDVRVQGLATPVFPTLPLMNFLALLLQAVTRGSAPVFHQLRSKYAIHLAADAAAWDGPLETVAEMYFDVARPRQSNPLLDMVGSFFRGGGGGGGGQARPRLVGRQVDTPIEEGLD